MLTLATGTVTFLFTDIEGSTKRAQEHPDEMPALLARHNEILKESIETNHGHVFLIAGDAFCAAFQNALDALRAAIAAQLSLSTQSWGEGGPLRVRMGLHTGLVELAADGGYSGYTTLAATQRIMSDAHGGQITVTSRPGAGSTFSLVLPIRPRLEPAVTPITGTPPLGG